MIYQKIMRQVYVTNYEREFFGLKLPTMFVGMLGLTVGILLCPITVATFVACLPTGNIEPAIDVGMFAYDCIDNGWSALMKA